MDYGVRGQARQTLHEYMGAGRTSRSEDSYGNAKGRNGHKGDFEDGQHRYGKGKHWRGSDGDYGTGCGTGRSRGYGWYGAALAQDGLPVGSRSDHAQPELSSVAWRDLQLRQYRYQQEEHKYEKKGYCSKGDGLKPPQEFSYGGPAGEEGRAANQTYTGYSYGYGGEWRAGSWH